MAKPLSEATAYQRHEFERVVSEVIEVLSVSRRALGLEPTAEQLPLWGQWDDGRAAAEEKLQAAVPGSDTAYALDVVRLLLEKTEALVDLRVAEVQHRMTEQMESLRAEIRALRPQ